MLARSSRGPVASTSPVVGLDKMESSAKFLIIEDIPVVANMRCLSPNASQTFPANTKHHTEERMIPYELLPADLFNETNIGSDNWAIDKVRESTF